MRGSVVAIGTELRSGQIINSNAAKLSAALTSLGVDSVFHITVPDDHGAILHALRSAELVSELIFVTGGLGPTTDDFTRDVVAAWAGLPLYFDDSAWARLIKKLELRGRVASNSQKQQCSFPQGAMILENPKGTAEAFFLRVRDRRVWVLPGPPLEIEAIWDAGVRKMIEQLIPDGPKYELLSWICKDKAESEIGDLVESIVRGTGLRTGYRCFKPYVEVKIWCLRSDLPKHSAQFDRINDALKNWLDPKPTTSSD